MRLPQCEKSSRGSGAAGPRAHENPRNCTCRAAPIGRWSLFPGHVDVPVREVYLDRWCWQLLARYGVLFREMLTRESAAPAWSDLVPQLRRMELRGEVSGGRFVSGVGGEQYLRWPRPSNRSATCAICLLRMNGA